MKNLTTSPVASTILQACKHMKHTQHSAHFSYCCDYAYHIQDKVYTPHSFNLQQQNASQTWTNFLTDLELEASDNVEYGVVNVASTWHAHVAL